jgi:nucleoid-associated protein YgaU
MGRDKVLGLSLAILLIGFAAAFCFRNEQFVESGLKLARTKILDEAIAQRPGPKPYASELKAERNKATLPTVTLQGIESVEPFSDLQTAQSADRDQAAAPKEKKKEVAEAATIHVDIKPSIETETPSIGTLTVAADTASVPVDTERAAPEINTSKPAAAPAPPVADGFATLSATLTSAAPPMSDPSNGENQAPSSDIVIRPNTLVGGRADSSVRQNVAWQSTAAQRVRGPLADNSPRNSSSLDNTNSDETPRDSWSRDNSTGDNSTRDNSTRDNSTREPLTPDASNHEQTSRDLSAGDNPIHDGSPRESASHDSRPNDNSGLGNPSSDGDGSSKSVNYRVRRGDTLTKISLHYFGDSSRYREIFEANRDQLHTPNDRLKIGMTLRIPSNTAKPKANGPVAKRKSRSSRSGSVTLGTSRTRTAPMRNVSRVRETPPKATIDKPPATPSDDDNMNSDPQPTNRFVPVRKAPFLPGSPQSNATAKPSGRRLSQRAPSPPADDSTSEAGTSNKSEAEETNGTKAKADSPPPAENRDSTTPDMSHYRFFSRSAPIRIAGDREDAIVR